MAVKWQKKGKNLALIPGFCLGKFCGYSLSYFLILCIFLTIYTIEVIIVSTIAYFSIESNFTCQTFKSISENIKKTAIQYKNARPVITAHTSTLLTMSNACSFITFISFFFILSNIHTSSER